MSREKLHIRRRPLTDFNQIKSYQVYQNKSQYQQVKL